MKLIHWCYMKFLSFFVFFQYLHSVATYPDRNEICSEIIDYLCTRQNKSDLDPDLSHHLLEVTLYKVNLSLMVGRLQYATNILQVTLFLKKSDLDPNLSHHLEVTLYKVNLSLMVGRLQYATNILQVTLFLKKSDLDPNLSHHLEVTLYKVNLSLMVGRLQYAANILQVTSFRPCL